MILRRSVTCYFRNLMCWCNVRRGSNVTPSSLGLCSSASEVGNQCTGVERFGEQTFLCTGSPKLHPHFASFSLYIHFFFVPCPPVTDCMTRIQAIFNIENKVITFLRGDCCS